MTSSPNRQSAFRVSPLVLILAAGLMLGCLVGCDETVQATIWTGLNDLAVSLVDALFQALDPANDTPTPVTASILDGAIPSPWA
jgi:hypothetical protein